MILHEEQLESSVNEKQSLYLRFPKKLNADRTLAESEVKSLNAKIIRVRIPRQRSANFCLVDFETKDEKEKALKKLKKVKIGDKHLVVKESVRNDIVKLKKKIKVTEEKREVNEALGKLVGEIKNSLAKNYSRRNVSNCVTVKELKSGTTQNDIKKLFPEAIDIKLNIKAQRQNSFALVWLPTPKDARDAAKETIRINGEEHAVIVQVDEKQKKRKRISHSNNKSNEDDSSEDVSASEESDVNESDDGDDMEEDESD